MGRVFKDNLSLRQQWLKVVQARVAAQISGSARWPQLEASLSQGRARSYDFMGNSATHDQYGVSAQVAYELDLWGQVESLTRAAVLAR